MVVAIWSGNVMSSVGTRRTTTDSLAHRSIALSPSLRLRRPALSAVVTASQCSDSGATTSTRAFASATSARVDLLRRLQDHGLVSLDVGQWLLAATGHDAHGVADPLVPDGAGPSGVRDPDESRLLGELCDEFGAVHTAQRTAARLVRVCAAGTGAATGVVPVASRLGEAAHERTDLVDRRAGLGHPGGSGLEHVDLAVPHLEIARHAGGDEAVGHQLGVGHEHLVGADVDQRGRHVGRAAC